MRYHRRSFNFALSAFLGATALTSLVQARPDCSSARNARQLQAGVASGAHAASVMVEFFGRVPGNDERVVKERLLEVLWSSLGLASGSNALACRAQGMIDGMFNQLALLQEATSCRFAHDFWGDFTGTLYCRIMTSFPQEEDLFRISMPRPSFGTCDLWLMGGCDSAFEAAVRGDESCRPFSEGAFEPILEAALGQQCGYVPLPLIE